MAAQPKTISRQLSSLTLHSNVIDLGYDKDHENEVTMLHSGNQKNQTGLLIKVGLVILQFDSPPSLRKDQFIL